MRRAITLIGVVAALAAPAATARAADRIYWVNTSADKISFANLDGGGGDVNTTGATVAAPDRRDRPMQHRDGHWVDFGGTDAGRIGERRRQRRRNLFRRVTAPVGLVDRPGARRTGVPRQRECRRIAPRRDIDGSQPAGINVTGATMNGPRGLTLDPAAGRVYWANNAGNKISFANVNGSGGGDLSTTGATVSGPWGVAIDPAAGRIYWSNSTGGKISFARLDGSGGGDLATTGATVDGPSGVAIDPGAGRIYWTSRTAKKVSFARLDGSGGGDLDTTGATTTDPQAPALLTAPVPTGSPAITGRSQAGSVLTCAAGTWAPDLVGAFLSRAPAKLTYAWSLGGTDIAGASLDHLHRLRRR